jgi:type IV secretion system protein VirB3
MGGDRELIMLSGLIAFALIFSAMEVRAAIFGIALWVTSLFLFRWMGKVDPLMRYVYLRHIRYAKYYPPRSTPWRDNSKAYR